MFDDGISTALTVYTDSGCVCVLQTSSSGPQLAYESHFVKKTVVLVRRRKGLRRKLAASLFIHIAPDLCEC